MGAGVNDIPIADWPSVLADCVQGAVCGFLTALAWAECATAHERWQFDAMMARARLWCEPACGLCGARRALTETQVTFLDDINYKIRDAYTLPICSDCALAITTHERSAA